MNISQLQYLISAAQFGSFTKAASVHHLTVPTISQSIRQLEEELDTVLFHRTKKGVAPTAEGELVLKYAMAILKNIDSMQHELLTLKENHIESITIATIPGFVPQVVQATLELMQEHPELKVQMIEGDTQTVLNQVQDGYADMGLLSYSKSQQNPSFEWVPIVEGSAVIIMNTSSPLRYLKTITPQTLKNEVFVLYKDEHIENIAHYLMSASDGNRISLITNNTDALGQMVFKGNAITIAPDFIVNALSSTYKEQLVTVPIEQLGSDSKAILGRITRIAEPIPKMIQEFTAKLTDLVNHISPQKE
ncbi:LysR family transcriptional regulator [Paenibacillus barcinonensis]|uniref:DNA-binding transcriptional LysR family regulator n=1 Tax=Paenibacillus barcinonensis TaxID=198119 RepID=A0A2V4VGU7_PAEBA|nr:LysR family transcriptional regulator [Paenibacillus barcinonensis]PYE45412.1 DNA-binding transcriptional LysR family regulator [Paenibacillus barcinonensis]QKS55229.1 LysR family transcriptional regulator [Paenibacillus barcinonensis]